MSSNSSSTHPEVQFRGIRERNLDDQVTAVTAGYNSVVEYAIDELARRLMLLEERVAKLEIGELIEGQD